MRTHPDIVKDYGIAETAALTGVSIYTVRSWVQRGRVPADHWQALIAADLTTADEMLAGIRSAA